MRGISKLAKKLLASEEELRMLHGVSDLSADLHLILTISFL